MSNPLRYFDEYPTFRYDMLPNLDALKHYVNRRRPLGGFLTAIAENDLRTACGQADGHNIWLIPIYVAWLYNNAPAQSWGSKAKVKAWLEDHSTPITKFV